MQSISQSFHNRRIRQKQHLTNKQCKARHLLGDQGKILSMSCNDDLEEFIKIVKIDSFEIAILNLLHKTLELCEQGPAS